MVWGSLLWLWNDSACPVCVCHDFAAALVKMFWNMTITSSSLGQTTELTHFFPEILTSHFKSYNISKTTSSKHQAHRQKFDVDERCLDPHLHLHWQRPVFLEKEKSLDSYPVLGLVLMRFHCCCGLLEAYPFSFLIWWYTMLVTDGHDAAVFILVPSKSCALVFLLNPYYLLPFLL